MRLNCADVGGVVTSGPAALPMGRHWTGECGRVKSDPFAERCGRSDGSKAHRTNVTRTPSALSRNWRSSSPIRPELALTIGLNRPLDPGDGPTSLALCHIDVDVTHPSHAKHINNAYYWCVSLVIGSASSQGFDPAFCTFKRRDSASPLPGSWESHWTKNVMGVNRSLFREGLPHSIGSPWRLTCGIPSGSASFVRRH